MTSKFSFLLFCFCSIYSFGQDEHPKEQKSTSYFVYVVPTSIPGNMIDLDNFWIQGGYGWLKNKSMYCFDIGAIVHSMPTKGGGYIGADLTQIMSNGYTLSFEHKFFFSKRFYYATQLNFQSMSTQRSEVTTIHPQGGVPYVVSRKELGLIPKIGFALVARKKFFLDIGIGGGVRYISSKNREKQNPLGNLQKEYFSNKVFDSGNKIAQRIMLQIRTGYSF